MRVAELPEYGIYSHIKTRCYNYKFNRYHRYGGRGIQMCERWRKDFAAFYEDMGSRPGIGYSIERVNNDGNYSCGYCEECVAKGWPANCRWATAKEQGNNTSQNILVTVAGRMQTITQWADESGISFMTLYLRIVRYGWSAEEALELKVRTGNCLDCGKEFVLVPKSRKLYCDRNCRYRSLRKA